MPGPGPSEADFIEAGSGPAVLLIHSSVAGARQWRALMDDLKSDYHVRAVQLYGYGGSPAWTAHPAQTLNDQARLVETALPPGDRPVTIVGHSFGGSVAMQVARRLGARVRKLVLLEPNPFSLLRDAGLPDAFAEACSLRDCVKDAGTRDDWMPAAARFADYWGGAGTWERTPADRRETFARALKPNFHEWDAVIDDRTPVSDWAASLPADTLVVSDPATVAPIRGIVGILRAASPSWTFRSVDNAGHMAPLTHPAVVNPIVRDFLLQ